MNSIKTAVKLAWDALDKAAPSILIGAGLLGGTTAGVKAVMDTPKALMIKEEKKGELKVENLPLLERVKIDAKVYWPSITLGALSAASIILAHKVDLRRQAALLACYEITDGKLKSYKDAVLKTVGEKKEEEIRNTEGAVKAAKIDTSNLVVISDSNKVRCIDSITGRQFAAKIEDIKAAVNEFNRRLTIEGSLSLNEFYDILKDITGAPEIDAISIGDDLGWDLNHGSGELLEVSYSSQLLNNNEPALLIEYNVQPKWWAFEYDK